MDEIIRTIRNITLPAFIILISFIFANGTLAQPPEAIPENVRIVEEGNGYVTVTWGLPELPAEAPTPLGYRILYRKTSDPPEYYFYNPDDIIHTENRTGTIRGLENGVWYEITVSSLGVTHGVSNSVALARPGGGNNNVKPPDPPNRIRDEASSQGKISWDPPDNNGGSPIEGYVVWYMTQDTNEWEWQQLPNILSPNIRTQTIPGLGNYRLYRVAVAAVNAEGTGLYNISYEWYIANRYDFGPHELISEWSNAQQYSLGEDLWEVWICDVVDGHLTINLEDTVTLLNNKIVPYFVWQSEGHYRPRFVAGGTVKADPHLTSGNAGGYECENKVTAETSGGTHGALIVVDKHTPSSQGGNGDIRTGNEGGYWQSNVLSSFPNNRRFVWVSARSVLPVSAYCIRCPSPEHVSLDIVAHELGHGLGWPHSYGLDDIDDNIDQYNNPMDIVSGGPTEPYITDDGLAAGTVASNRYASGWITSDQLAVHRGPTPGEYWMHPVGEDGLQMLAVSDGTPGRFLSLGVQG